MRSAIVTVLLALLGSATIADETSHPVTLWEVKGNNNSVYLLGSIHLLRPQDYPLPAVLDAAYEEAEVLIMEIDMDDMDPLAAQAAFTTYGVLRDAQTLQSLMGDELYQEALEAAELIDIPLEMLSKTEPWYAAMTIEIMMLSRIGFDPSLGIEMYMLAKAQNDGKPIEGFETIEEQLQFLDGMSLDAQREMLLSTLTDSAELEEMMDDMIDAWHLGDTAVLEAGMLEELAEHEELSKALVTDRNARWIEQINPLLDDSDDYLIVVGALHLIGKDGVPMLLQRNGFEVRQLSTSPSVR
jgi:uncharacterized protein YbaP (TraB family)